MIIIMMIIIIIIIIIIMYLTWLHKNIINRCQLGPNSILVKPEHNSVLLSLITRLHVGVRVDISNYTVRKKKRI
jgi:hypothetical protein